MCKNYFIFFVNGLPNACLWLNFFKLDNISPYNIHWKTSLFCTWYVSGARVATFKIYNPYCDKEEQTQ